MHRRSSGLRTGRSLRGELVSSCPAAGLPLALPLEATPHLSIQRCPWPWTLSAGPGSGPSSLSAVAAEEEGVEPAPDDLAYLIHRGRGCHLLLRNRGIGAVGEASP